MHGWVFVGVALDDVDVRVALAVEFGNMVVVPLMTLSVSRPMPPPSSKVMVLVEPGLVVVEVPVPVPEVPDDTEDEGCWLTIPVVCVAVTCPVAVSYVPVTVDCEIDPVKVVKTRVSLVLCEATNGTARAVRHRVWYFILVGAVLP